MNKHSHCFNCTFCAKLINRPLILICFHPVCLECITSNQKEEIINSQKFIKIQCKKCSLFTLFSQDFSEKYSDKDLKDFLQSDHMSIQSNKQKISEDEKQPHFNNNNFNINNNLLNKPKQIEQQFQVESNLIENDDDQNQKLKINNSTYRNMSPSNIKFQEQKNGLAKNNQLNQQQQPPQQNQQQLDKTINKNIQQYNQGLESTQNRNLNNQKQKMINSEFSQKGFNFDQQPQQNKQEANKENINQIQNFTTFQPYNQMQTTEKENDNQFQHQNQNEQQQQYSYQQSLQKNKRSIPKAYNNKCRICQNNNKQLEDNINNYSRNCPCCDQIDKQNNEEKSVKSGLLFDLTDNILMQKYNNLQKSIGICSLHSSEPLLFCIDCKEFICLECHFIRNEHKNHQIQSIKQSLKQIGEHNQKMFDGLMMNEQDIAKQIEYAQMNHNVLGKKHQETLQQLQLLFKKIQLELQKKEVQLTSQIDQFYSDRLKANHVALQNLNILKAKVPEIKAASTTLQNNNHEYSTSINIFYNLQIFTNFLNKMSPIIAESGNQIPQIIFDKNLKILSEIQNFAYFQQTPTQKQEKALNQSFYSQTHTNVQTFMQPDLKDLNNSQYRQYLKNQKENMQLTRSALKQQKESGKKEKQLNSSYKKLNQSPYHKQLEVNRQDQGVMERIQGIKKNIY